MREFELMPNEEQMMDMAKEYSKVKARKEAMNAHSHEKCSADKNRSLSCRKRTVWSVTLW